MSSEVSERQSTVHRCHNREKLSPQQPLINRCIVPQCEHYVRPLQLVVCDPRSHWCEWGIFLQEQSVCIHLSKDGFHKTPIIMISFGYACLGGEE